MRTGVHRLISVAMQQTQQPSNELRDSLEAVVGDSILIAIQSAGDSAVIRVLQQTADQANSLVVARGVFVAALGVSSSPRARSSLRSSCGDKGFEFKKQRAQQIEESQQRFESLLDESMRRLACIPLVTLLLGSLSVGAAGQDRPLRVRAGVTQNGSQHHGWGGHALADFRIVGGERLSVLLGGSLALGGFTDAGATADRILGLDALGVLPLGGAGFYVGLGPSYSFDDSIGDTGAAYGLGYSVAVGLSFGDQGAWATELRVRKYGDFYSARADQGLLLISLGRAIG